MDTYNAGPWSTMPCSCRKLHPSWPQLEPIPYLWEADHLRHPMSFSMVPSWGIPPKPSQTIPNHPMPHPGSPVPRCKLDGHLPEPWLSKHDPARFQALTSQLFAIQVDLHFNTFPNISNLWSPLPCFYHLCSRPRCHFRLVHHDLMRLVGLRGGRALHTWRPVIFDRLGGSKPITQLLHLLSMKVIIIDSQIY